MAPWCFVHASNVRLDTPFEGVGHVPPTIAEALRDASLGAWDALVRFAIDRDAAFLLLAGNTYDGPARGVRGQLRFLRGLERLAERGIRTFIVHGAHDPHDGWTAIRAWPPEVKLFGADGVAAARVERGGELLATVYGRSFAGPSVPENLALGFRRGEGAGIHVGLLACDVGGAAGERPASPCSADDLIHANMDYFAVGHARNMQVFNEAPCWVAASGMLQGRSTAPEDYGPKGALLCEVEGDAVTRIAFEPLDQMRFVAFDLDSSAADDLPALRNALLGQCAQIKAAHPGRGLLVRAVLRGRGVVHSLLKKADALGDLLRDLREEAEEESSLVWWEAILDATQSDTSRDVIRRRNDFSAELLRQGDLLRADPQALGAFAADGTKALNRLAASRSLSPLDAAGLAALLGEAEDLALDVLEGAGEP